MQQATIHDNFNVHYLEADENTSVTAAFDYLQNTN